MDNQGSSFPVKRKYVQSPKLPHLLDRKSSSVVIYRAICDNLN